MCGRFVLHHHIEDLLNHYGLVSHLDFRPTYNAAPSQMLPVVRNGEADRELVLCKWGLIPSWAKTVPANKPINARSETVAEKPYFRAAFKRRRCLVPVSGFYEWKRTGGPKVPHYFRLQEPGSFTFAGIWDRWAAGAEPVDTFAIITAAANDIMEPVHDRMPVILDPNQYDSWLEHGGTDLLQPYAGAMTCYPVSTRVNSTRNNGPELIEPTV